MDPLRRARTVAVIAATALCGIGWMLSAPLSRADEERLWRYRNLGKAFYENPTTQRQAVEEFRKARDLAPGSARETLNYGLALLRAGERRRASRSWRRRRSSIPSCRTPGSIWASRSSGRRSSTARCPSSSRWRAWCPTTRRRITSLARCTNWRRSAGGGPRVRAGARSEPAPGRAALSAVRPLPPDEPARGCRRRAAHVPGVEEAAGRRGRAGRHGMERVLRNLRCAARARRRAAGRRGLSRGEAGRGVRRRSRGHGGAAGGWRSSQPDRLGQRARHAVSATA
jgi:hypothetical protein